jgi:uncharacterized repeat protein (TIGR03803 family)
MKILKNLKMTLTVLALGLAAPLATAQTTTVLHAFCGINNRSLPYGGLVMSSSNVLYGTTSGGGSGNTGTIFQINPDGSGKSTLHSFAAYGSDSTNSDGAKPYATLLLSGSTLYGTTSAGGSSGAGTVFKINTDGTGFTTLYTFTGGTDGATPLANLILSGSTLYGTASAGGGGYGIVFKVNTNGTGFTVLYSFTDGADGANPVGGLVLSGGTLYGTAEEGGADDSGTIFKVSTSGTGFTTLYTFTANEDGSAPEASLILSGSTLYGTANLGGYANTDVFAGTIFKINTDGSGFTTLYVFTDEDDGAYPTAPLVLSGSTLYGTASMGGDEGGGAGTVFSVSTSGKNFTVLHGFSSTSILTDSNSDGAYPNAGLVLSGGTLYGTAVAGGSGGTGVLFSVTTSGGSFTDFHEFVLGDNGLNPRTPLLLSGSTLYGTTDASGAVDYANSTLFSVNTDGSGYTMLYNFTGNGVGSGPEGELATSSNTIYGTCPTGAGANGFGAVFSISTSGTNFAILHSFGSTTNELTNSDGIDQEGVVLSSSTLYGVASFGGTNGNGTIYKVNTDGTGFTVLHTFSAFPVGSSTNSDGAHPFAGLIVSGGTLYGTTFGGGSGGNGTVFSIGTSGTNFTTLYNFTGGNDGASPEGKLALSGSTLYGTTYMGGANGTGTVFSVSTSGTGFTTLHTFGALSSGDNSDGANSVTGLALSGSTLYGTAYDGGPYGNGTVFSLSTSGSGFTVVHSFGTLSGPAMSNTYGANPVADLIVSSGILYGTALNGGSMGCGTVFSENP